jgi:hypothetical protein
VAKELSVGSDSGKMCKDNPSWSERERFSEAGVFGDLLANGGASTTTRNSRPRPPATMVKSAG